MLTRVEIANYRGFESYRMAGLAQLNLLVGRNNTGKTALLEGIQFLTSGGDPAVLAEAAERRGELIVVGREPSFNQMVDIAHFFHGHTLALDTSISFTGDNGYAPVTVKAIAQKNGRADAASAHPPQAESVSFFLKITGPHGRERKAGAMFPISREGGVNLDVPPRFRRAGVSRSADGPQVRFVGSESVNSIQLAIMWDDVTTSGQEADVAAAMRVLEPKLESVHPLTGMFASGYFPSRGGFVVGLKDQEPRLPLGSMGDGMRRLMALATSLAFTKNGCLFVDEIDTGLHYSVMPDMWELVIKKAVASNIQVFATTHSWDCIEGLCLLGEREPGLVSKATIHKIDRAIPHSVAFSGGAIVRMVKSDIDPR